MKLSEFTIKKLGLAIKERGISSVELTSSILKRIEENEHKIDSYITVTPEVALNDAKRIDKLLSSQQNLSPIAGIPASIKDLIVTKDIKTTCGSKVLEDFIPPYDASVYEKLKNSGEVTLGKTNMDEFAMGSSTENSAYKVTKNPWDLKKVPGGSSGGSAASVSADLAVYSLGSDTGGSIRQPASFCGVVGLKPTYGRVSRYGLVAMASSLDQIGPITKTVEDAALVLNEIAGFDPKDSNSAPKEVPDYTKNLRKGLDGFKIGIPREYFAEGVDKRVSNTVSKALKHLEEQGARIVDLSLPISKDAIAVYYILMTSEVSANMARYDGIRYGNEREKFGPEVKRRILLGTYALSSGYYDAYFLKAAKVRTLIINEFKEAFKKVDVIAGPTTPTTAFDIGEKTDDPLKMYLEDLLTVPQNLAGVPAISIPCGFVDNLPVGLQITGNHWEEEKILNVAHVYEQSTDWYKQKPKL